MSLSFRHVLVLALLLPLQVLASRELVYRHGRSRFQGPLDRLLAGDGDVASLFGLAQGKQALIVASGPTLQHNLATGLELTREKSEGRTYAEVRPQVAVDPFNPDWQRTGPTAKRGQLRDLNEVTVDTVALYVYDTIELNKQWQVTGGLERVPGKHDDETLVSHVNGGAGGTWRPVSRPMPAMTMPRPGPMRRSACPRSPPIRG